MPSAKLAVVGLKNSGKSIFHTTLFARPSPLYRRGVTLAFPKASQRLLGPLARLLESGQPLPATALEKSRIDWSLKVPSTRVGWAVESFDAAGELFASDREEAKDKLAVAQAVDQFLDGCDGMLYLIDPSDDAKLQQQLGTLDRVLSYNTRRPSRAKPIALVYTKADSYLPHFERYHDEVASRLAPADAAGQVAAEEANQAALRTARSDLTAYLNGRSTGRQLLHFTGSSAQDNSLYQTFPISCVRTFGGGFQIAPVWAHEPLLWALEQVYALRRYRRGQSWKFAKRVALAAVVTVAAAGAGLWWHGRTQSQDAFSALEKFRAEHPGPENGDLRRRETEAFLAKPYVRYPYQFPAFLAEQKQKGADDRKAFLDHHLALLSDETKQKGDAGNYPACFKLIDDTFLTGIPETEYRDQVTTLRATRRTERNQKELERLQKRVDDLATKVAAPPPDLTADDFVRAITDAERSFLRDEEGFAVKKVQVSERAITLLHKFRYDGLLRDLGPEATTEAGAVRQSALVNAFLKDPLTEQFPFPAARREELAKRGGDSAAAGIRFKHQEELAKWTDAHGKFASAVAEELKKEKPDDTTLASRLDDAIGGLSKSFLSKHPDYADQRRKLQNDLTTLLHDIRYGALVGRLGPAPKSYPEALAQLGHLKAANDDLLTLAHLWPADIAAKLKKHAEDAKTAAFEFRMADIRKALAAKVGDAKAGERVAYLDAVGWLAILGEPPAAVATELKQLREKEFAAWREHDLNGPDGLFTRLDKLEGAAKGKERADLIRAAQFTRWREDKAYGTKITDKLEEAEFDHVRFLDASKDSALANAASAFLAEWPKSDRREKVKGIAGDAKWKEVEEAVGRALSPRVKVARIREYLKLDYLTADARVRAEARETEIGTAWAKAEFKKLDAVGKIDGWEKFDKALAGAKQFRLVDKKFAPNTWAAVDALAGKLEAYETGVGGLELRACELNLSDLPAGLADKDTPKATVYFKGELPAFKLATDLGKLDALPPYNWFLANRDYEATAETVKYHGYKQGQFFSGPKRKFQVALDVPTTDKYSGFASKAASTVDFGDDFFKDGSGKSTLEFPYRITDDNEKELKTLTVKVTFQWRGSKLHELKLPDWAD